MDLGIAGRNAMVCASSRGLGRACAVELARAGVRLLVNGRDPERLEKVRHEISDKTGAEVLAVAADLTTEEGRAALLAAMPEPDILVNNNNGPPPRDFRAADHDAMLAGPEANMIAPPPLIPAGSDDTGARRVRRRGHHTPGSG